jgi:MFS family permease
MAAMLVDSLGTGLFLPFTILYFIHTTALSAAAVGVALTGAGLVVLPVPLTVARLIDSYGAKAVVAAGNLITGVAFGVYVVVGNQLELFGAAVVAGIGQAAFWTAMRALVGEVTAPEERRTWFALQTAIRNVGYGTGGVLGAIAVTLGTLTAFRTLAGLDALSYLGAAVVLWRWRPPAAVKPPVRQPVATAPAPTSYRAVLADRALLGLSAVNMAFVVCALVLTIAMSVYFVKTLHEPPWLVSVAFTVNTLLVVAAQTPLTVLTRNVPSRRVMRLVALGWAASFALLWAARFASRGLVAPGLVMAVVIYTFAEMALGPTINALAVELAPPGAPGRHLSFFQFSFSLGAASAPVLLTWLLSAGPQFLWSTLIVACLLVAIGIDRIVPASAPPVADAEPESARANGSER